MTTVKPEIKELTLRDYFAAAALPALIAKDAAAANAELAADLHDDDRDEDGGLVRPIEAVYDEPCSYRDVVAGAYAVADAMLLAREGKEIE